MVYEVSWGYLSVNGTTTTNGLIVNSGYSITTPAITLNGTNLATESEIKGNITVDYLLQQSDINSVLDKLDYIYRNKPKEETANV